MDVDDRWWVDLIIQDQPPEVSYVSIGSQIACDGLTSRMVESWFGGRASNQPISAIGPQIPRSLYMWWPNNAPLIS